MRVKSICWKNGHVVLFLPASHQLRFFHYFLPMKIQQVEWKDIFPPTKQQNVLIWSDLGMSQNHQPANWFASKWTKPVSVDFRDPGRSLILRHSHDIPHLISRLLLMSGSHSGQRCRSPRKLQMISVLAVISALRSHGAMVWQGKLRYVMFYSYDSCVCAQIANGPESVGTELEHEIGVRQNLFCPII